MAIDSVAGRTGKQIEAAKRAQAKRLGQSGAAGKQKRCKKGKSCGATCINSSKVCMVDIPWATGQQITKVAKEIQTRPGAKPAGKKPPTVDEIKAKLKEHHTKFKEAAIAEDGKEYTKHRKEIQKYLKELKDRGEQVPDIPLPTWAKISPIIREAKTAEARGDQDGKNRAIQKLKDALLRKKEPAAKPTLPLRLLETNRDFESILANTFGVSHNPKLVEDSREVAKVLGSRNSSHPGAIYQAGEQDKYDAIRKKIGGSIVADGSYALSAFTSSYDTSYNMRQADKGAPGSRSFKNMADHLDKLLNLDELPKTEIEKFRGFRASPDRLQEMIESAGLKESFTMGSANSWSSSLRIGKKFSNRQIYGSPERTERVIFRTINKRGVPIEFVTSVTGEDEILTPRGVKYKYLGYREITTPTGGVYHVFDVEEM